MRESVCLYVRARVCSVCIYGGGDGGGVVPSPSLQSYDTNVKGIPAGDKDPTGRVAAVHDTPNPVEIMELGTIAKPVGATGASWILIGAVAAEVSAEEVLSYLEYTERL